VSFQRSVEEKAKAGMIKYQVTVANQKRMTKSQSSTICLGICVHPWFTSQMGSGVQGFKGTARRISVICEICG